MAVIEAHGIAAALPNGFEGRIFVRAVPTGTAYAVAQFATFPLPDDVGDFGGGAVNLMGPGDVYATLFEYGPESLGKQLFARLGRPTRLRAERLLPDDAPSRPRWSVRHPALLHRVGPALHLLCRAGQPRAAEHARPEGQCAPGLHDPRSTDVQLHATRSGADVELIGIYLIGSALLVLAGAAKAIRPGDTALALAQVLPGHLRLKTLVRVGAACEAGVGSSGSCCPDPCRRRWSALPTWDLPRMWPTHADVTASCPRAVVSGEPTPLRPGFTS